MSNAEALALTGLALAGAAFLAAVVVSGNAYPWRRYGISTRWWAVPATLAALALAAFGTAPWLAGSSRDDEQDRYRVCIDAGGNYSADVYEKQYECTGVSP